MDKSLFMRPEPDDLQMLIDKYRTMDIEELKENIDNWKKENDCFTEPVSYTHLTLPTKA